VVGLRMSKHCYVWAWRRDGDLCQKCPHCGYESHTWPSISDHDDDRVKESQQNHKDRCPGSPWCATRKDWRRA
jgi:hypothetical protein